MKKSEGNSFFRFELITFCVPLGKSFRLSKAHIPCVGGEKRIHRRRVCFHPLLFIVVVSNVAVAEPRRAISLRVMRNRSNFRKIDIPAAMDKHFFAAEGRSDV